MPGDDAQDQGRDSPEGPAAGDAPLPAPGGSTEALRSAFADLEDRLRVAMTQAIPDGEVAPSSGSGVRRALKRRHLRLMRPVSHRYDRLAADLAGLTAGLAERLAVAEADAYYWAFEQAMRDSQESIESRLRRYEPRLVALRASSGVPEPRWLDLRCGNALWATSD